MFAQSSPKVAPVCAMTSKSCDWNVRNIAKISPKLVKNSQFWTSPIFSNTLYCLKELLWSLSTPLKGLSFAILSNSYDWDSSESEGKDPICLFCRTSGSALISDQTDLINISLFLVNLIAEYMVVFLRR